MGGALASGRCPFTQVRHKAGTLLCNQGVVHSSVYFIREGLVSLSTLNRDGTEQGFALRGPRALLFAECLKGEPAMFEVRTLTEGRFCALERSQAWGWLGPEGSPARTVLGLVLDSFLDHQRDLNRNSGDCLARVARFALEFARMAGNGRSPLGQKQLVARLLGMRPETLSRCLRILQDDGLIEARAEVKVLNAAKLRVVARGDSPEEEARECNA